MHLLVLLVQIKTSCIAVLLHCKRSICQVLAEVWAVKTTFIVVYTRHQHIGLNHGNSTQHRKADA